MLKFSKLNRAQQRQLRTGHKLEEHGISFERLSNGDGRYTMNIMVDGQRIHRVIGKESDGVTRKQAESLIETLRTNAREGRLNLPVGRKLALSFKEATEKYLKKLTVEGGRNIAKKTNRLHLHLIPFFEDISLSHITISEIERYKNEMI